jgi:hypothetical protein
MISLEDCIALCGLTKEEVDAIAEHEHLPEIAAATLARYLLGHCHGSDEIRRMILDDFREALRIGDTRHAGELASALRHFLAGHPQVPAAPA